MKRLIFLIPLFFLVFTLYSQVIIYPPALSHGGNPTIVQLMYGILNNTGTTALNVKLHVVCTDKGQAVADVKSKSFSLPAGTTVLNALNAENLLYPVDVKYSSTKYINYGIKTSTLPPGDYEICVSVLKAHNDSVVGYNCYSLPVENFTSVNLLTPMNNGLSKTFYPIFTWSKVAGMASAFSNDIYYSLKIVEIIDEQSSIIAMQSNPVLFKEDEINFNLFQYPVTSHPLEACKKYAWQIESFQGIGISKKSLIKSEIWSFRIDCEQVTHWEPNGKKPPDVVKTKNSVKEVKPSTNTNNNGACSDLKFELRKIYTGDSATTGGNNFEKRKIYTGDSASNSNFNVKESKIYKGDSAISSVGKYVERKIYTGDSATSSSYNVKESKIYRGDSATSSVGKYEEKKIYTGDSVTYSCKITNNYKGADTTQIPKSFKLKINNSIVFSINDTLPKGLNRTPSKFPPGSSSVTWSNRSGIFPEGETNLGNIQFAKPTASPFYVIYEWLNKDEKTICKDSVAIDETIFYYELDKKQSNTYTKISNSTLNVQFFNNSASEENIKISIIDFETKKLKRKSRDVIKLNSVSGMNRISIDIKDYNLEPGILYLLTISNLKNNYYFNFKVSNDREK